VNPWQERRHPDVVQTANGTLVVVYAAMENPTAGKDVLMCTRSTNLGESWSNPTPILCSRFTARPKDHVRLLDLFSAETAAIGYGQSH
jgi:hypothetical protein